VTSAEPAETRSSWPSVSGTGPAARGFADGVIEIANRAPAPTKVFVKDFISLLISLAAPTRCKCLINPCVSSDF
jgi:hypothetical protein